jgi:hypothetical protein
VISVRNVVQSQANKDENYTVRAFDIKVRGTVFEEKPFRATSFTRRPRQAIEKC